MIHVLMVDNGEILEDLRDNISPTLTREHYLLNSLKAYDDIDLISIPYKQLSRTNFVYIMYNNIIKSIVALNSVFILLKKKPFVFFTYPSSLTTIQNQILFRFCKYLNLKIILDVQDTIEQSEAIGNGRSKLNKNIERYCFKHAKLLLILNRKMWQYIKNQYELPSKNVLISPNGFEKNLIEEYPAPYKSTKNRFNICYVGGITKNRGIDILVQACVELHEKYPYIKLDFIGFYGEGISKGLKEVIETSDFIVRKQVPRKEIIKMFQDVDTFVMPYDPKEGYLNRSSPTKLYEYIGCGRPIICTKCESLTEIGKDGSILYVDYDVEDFKRKIEFLIKNPQVREEMSKKLISIRPEYLWDKRGADLHEVIKSLK
jgi:glycosyltransferase involved in cell wall biosynthesis